MALTTTSSPSSSTPESDPVKVPAPEGFNLAAFRETKEAQGLVAWIRQEQSRAKSARTTNQQQWALNAANFAGKQWLERMAGRNDQTGKLFTPKVPYYRNRKTVNRIRSFVRAEIAQYMANVPEAVAVPATAENEDVRAAYAGEQAWQSISETQKLRTQYGRAIWWMVVTGNGFIKTWWDDTTVDRFSGDTGIIRYGNVAPLNLFVPDLREQAVDDQPFIINAYSKTVSWCRNAYGAELEGVALAATSSSDTTLQEENFVNLGAHANQLDSCIVYEAWVKPGAHKLLPEGGVVIMVDDTIVQFFDGGLPYNHGQYPYTKFENIPTAGFYADSALNDLVPLQREYNLLRTQISDAGNRMARPQLLVPKGSIAPGKLTNEPGMMIEYNPGLGAPTPIPLASLPDYYVAQQDRVLTDFEDIGGQHDVSRGVAPKGVTAGTAINFLQEADSSYRTPQFQSIEDGYERIAGQTLELFVQCVDMRRKIKTVGTDGAFDTMLLSGADIKNGTDIRIQKGSGVGVSKAAQDARVMDLFQLGVIPPERVAMLLEVGGAQKILDIIQVAEKKAQRENSRMKMLKPLDIENFEMQWEQQFLEQGAPPMTDPSGAPTGDSTLVSAGDQPEAQQADVALEEGMGDPMAGPEEGIGEEMGGFPQDFQPGPPPPPPVINVDDFDVHEKHIEVHNAFRMSQEYETLAPEVKEQFARHVALHTKALQQKQMMSFLSMIPSDGSDPNDPNAQQSMDVTTGAPEEEGGPGMMAANGAVPEPDLTGE